MKDASALTLFVYLLFVRSYLEIERIARFVSKFISNKSTRIDLKKMLEKWSKFKPFTRSEK